MNRNGKLQFYSNDSESAESLALALSPHPRPNPDRISCARGCIASKLLDKSVERLLQETQTTDFRGNVHEMSFKAHRRRIKEMEDFDGGIGIRFSFHR